PRASIGTSIARRSRTGTRRVRAAALMRAFFSLALYCALSLIPLGTAQAEDASAEVGAVAFARQSRLPRRRADAEEGPLTDLELAHRRRAQARAFGAMLRKARLLKGVSQEQLALEAGITVYTYGGLERGHTPRGGEVNPTMDTVMRIIHALDIDIELKFRFADGP
ncbi:MAG: hypothetical protein B7X41_18230, partial [Microbacterium sp. 14-71-5]